MGESDGRGVSFRLLMLRARSMPPDPLPVWPWRQATVWRDEAGGLHRIESMSEEALAEAVRVCLDNAERVRFTLMFDAYAEGWRLRLAGDEQEAGRCFMDAIGMALVDGPMLIEQTPLLIGLREAAARSCLSASSLG